MATVSQHKCRRSGTKQGCEKKSKRSQFNAVWLARKIFVTPWNTGYREQHDTLGHGAEIQGMGGDNAYVERKANWLKDLQEKSGPGPMGPIGALFSTSRQDRVKLFLLTGADQTVRASPSRQWSEHRLQSLHAVAWIDRYTNFFHDIHAWKSDQYQFCLMFALI